MYVKKLTKKASKEIVSLAQACNKSLTKNTSYDEAWEAIATYGNLTCTMALKRKEDKTFFNLIKITSNKKGEELEEQINEFSWPNSEVYISNEGDWDWTKIYKDVLEWIVENKIVKKPRKPRCDKKIK